ncbi:MAG TPA: pilus assembly protein TadG-related protein [Patescibacteria group bacterium]|nr:pilus assembly protein TadG-related protein [Patescibacteria group bacterium]
MRLPRTDAIMQKRNHGSRARDERGATLVFIGLSMAALLGVMALAIDLGMLYVGRGEAQRAADAAALAGAQVFSQSGCTSGDCSADTTTQAAAKAQAITVGDTNYVLQQQVNIASSDVALNFPQATEPQVTVTVRRSSIPLIFAQVFGKSVADVSATATAEAFQPGNTDVQCPVPFAIANCDTNYLSDGDPLTGPDGSKQNQACPSNAGYLVCCSSSSPNPWSQTDTGVLGQPVLLHFATSSGSAVASQWNLLDFGTAPSGSQLESYIESCPTQGVAGCGNVPVTTGDKVGPVDHGIDTLINALGSKNKSKPTDGMDEGQDIITGPGGTGTPTYDSTTGAVRYSITGGADNTSEAGSVGISGSKSVVTAPIYSNVAGTTTTQLQSGQPSQEVQIVAWAKLFIVDAEAPGSGKTTDPCNSGGSVSNSDSPVCAYVLQIVPNCGTGTTVNTQYSPVPIRLIQGPTTTP